MMQRTFIYLVGSLFIVSGLSMVSVAEPFLDGQGGFHQQAAARVKAAEAAAAKKKTEASTPKAAPAQTPAARPVAVPTAPSVPLECVFTKTFLSTNEKSKKVTRKTSSGTFVTDPKAKGKNSFELRSPEGQNMGTCEYEFVDGKLQVTHQGGLYGKPASISVHSDGKKPSVNIIDIDGGTLDFGGTKISKSATLTIECKPQVEKSAKK